MVSVLVTIWSSHSATAPCRRQQQRWPARAGTKRIAREIRLTTVEADGPSSAAPLERLRRRRATHTDWSGRHRGREASAIPPGQVSNGIDAAGAPCVRCEASLGCRASLDGAQACLTMPSATGWGGLAPGTLAPARPRSTRIRDCAPPTTPRRAPRARRCRGSRARTALALMVLVHSPVRADALASLDLERHFDGGCGPSASAPTRSRSAPPTPGAWRRTCAG